MDGNRAEPAGTGDERDPRWPAHDPATGGYGLPYGGPPAEADGDFRPSETSPVPLGPLYLQHPYREPAEDLTGRDVPGGQQGQDPQQGQHPQQPASAPSGAGAGPSSEAWTSWFTQTEAGHGQPAAGQSPPAEPTAPTWQQPGPPTTWYLAPGPADAAAYQDPYQRQPVYPPPADSGGGFVPTDATSAIPITEFRDALPPTRNQDPPDQQPPRAQYPQAQDPAAGYSDTQYPDARYSGPQYSDGQYLDAQYFAAGYPHAQYPPTGQYALPAAPADPYPADQAPPADEQYAGTPQYQPPQYPAGYVVPQYQTDLYQTGQFQTPQQYQDPQHQAQQYDASQYQAPQYQTPEYQAPQFQAGVFPAAPYQDPLTLGAYGQDAIYPGQLGQGQPVADSPLPTGEVPQYGYQPPPTPAGLPALPETAALPEFTSYYQPPPTDLASGGFAPSDTSAIPITAFRESYNLRPPQERVVATTAGAAAQRAAAKAATARGTAKASATGSTPAVEGAKPAADTPPAKRGVRRARLRRRRQLAVVAAVGVVIVAVATALVLSMVDGGSSSNSPSTTPTFAVGGAQGPAKSYPFPVFGLTRNPTGSAATSMSPGGALGGAFGAAGTTSGGPSAGPGPIILTPAAPAAAHS